MLGATLVVNVEHGLPLRRNVITFDAEAAVRGRLRRWRWRDFRG